MRVVAVVGVVVVDDELWLHAKRAVAGMDFVTLPSTQPVSLKRRRLLRGAIDGRVDAADVRKRRDDADWPWYWKFDADG